jgi:excisionase family DNA binding protein
MSDSHLYSEIELHVKDSRVSKRLYTVQEAATKLSLHPSWLYERTRKNEIPCRRFGKYIRFTNDDIEAIIASGATNQKTEIEKGA